MKIELSGLFPTLILIMQTGEIPWEKKKEESENLRFDCIKLIVIYVNSV